MIHVNYSYQAAMSKKGLADTEQGNAVKIVEGEYPAQYTKNTQDLQRIEPALQPFPEQISKIRFIQYICIKSLSHKRLQLELSQKISPKFMGKL